MITLEDNKKYLNNLIREYYPELNNVNVELQDGFFYHDKRWANSS